MVFEIFPRGALLRGYLIPGSFKKIGMSHFQSLILFLMELLHFLTLIFIISVLGDEKKLEVTLNVFKNLNGGDAFEEQKLMSDLKELEARMVKGKDKFLEQKPMKSINF